MAFRPEFVEALRLVAAASDRVVARGCSRPVIVGGAAAEFYSGGTVPSGDFDLVVASQAVFEEELVALGFERPRGSGKLTRGWQYPDLLIGVEVVGSRLLDGDTLRVHLVDLSTGTAAFIVVEDLIGDRMGQFHSDERSRRDMLGQAVRLLQLAKDLDEPYLEKRIRHETAGAYGLEFLRKEASCDHA